MSRLPDPGVRDGSKKKGNFTMLTTRLSLDFDLKPRKSCFYTHKLCAGDDVASRAGKHVDDNAFFPMSASCAAAGQDGFVSSK